MTGDTPEDLESQLVARGFEPRQRLVSMASTVEPSADSQARLVADPEERKAVAGFMARQFFWSMPAEAREAIAAATAASAHTVWCIGGSSDPDAAVMLVEQGGAVGLFNLCVKPELRGTGVGAGLVRLVQKAASARSQPVVLQCAEDLVGWYENLGFERVGTITALTLANGQASDILV